MIGALLIHLIVRQLTGAGDAPPAEGGGAAKPAKRD